MLAGHVEGQQGPFVPGKGQRQPSVEICFDDGEGPEAQEHLDRTGGQQTARPVASHECEGLVGGLGAEPGAEALVAAGDGVDVEWEGSGRSQGCGEATPWGMDVSFEEDAIEGWQPGVGYPGRAGGGTGRCPGEPLRHVLGRLGLLPPAMPAACTACPPALQTSLWMAPAAADGGALPRRWAQECDTEMEIQWEG